MQTEMRSLLSNWTSAQSTMLEKGVLLAQHNLHKLELFSEQGLIDLLDNHPQEALTVSTMGTDFREFQWREGDRDGVPSRELLELVCRGRLWLNLRDVTVHHRSLGGLVDQLYNELEAQSPGFRAIQRSANLLISSPGCIVHYHLDVPVNMLWHISGRKRVWVYPAFDERFAPQAILERVCASEQPEDIPYEPSFDQYALVFDVQPGQLLTWPQFTPHRVENLEGLNVSLSTEHYNATAKLRVNVHLANHFLRHQLGWKSPRAEIHGVMPQLKQAMIRGVRMAQRLAGRAPSKRNTYPKTFVVDPKAPLGYSAMPGETSESVLPGLAREFCTIGGVDRPQVSADGERAQ